MGLVAWNKEDDDDDDFTEGLIFPRLMFAVIFKFLTPY